MTAHVLSLKTLVDLGWLVFLLLVFRYFWRARRVTGQTKHWVKTRGRVTQCEWAVHGHSIWPKIEYIYQIDDKDVTGEYLFLDTVHNDPNSKYARNMAYKVANAYKNNEDIDVYYNPDRPEEAVLDTTIPRKLNLILVFTATLIILHLVITALRLFR
jgi:hypothetical protein